MASFAALAVCLALLVGSVTADIYLHNMRGSNNRLDEANRDRDNANRSVHRNKMNFRLTYL